MSMKPILFSGPMVRALLDGRKTQTRRVLKPQPNVLKNGRWYQPFTDKPEHWQYALGDHIHGYLDVKFRRGDLLWVRENAYFAPDRCAYAADNPSLTNGERVEGFGRCRPSIHMPRWASRITLEVTGVKLERLQDISREDAIAEGIEVDQSGRFNVIAWRNYAFDNHPFNCAIASFRSLWCSINGADAWDANPWVVAPIFTVHKVNVDAFAREVTA